MALVDAEAQKHNPMGRLTQSKDEFTKVLVLSQQDAILGKNLAQEVFIGGPAQVFDGKQHVVAVGAPSSHQAGVAAFIRQEVQRAAPSANRISSAAM